MYQKAMSRLKKVRQSLQTGEDEELTEINNAKDEVLDTYQSIFSFDHLPNLASEEFKSFLLYKNNQH